MFTPQSKAIIYGKHLDVAQRMSDFDYMAGRSCSVMGIIDPSSHKTTYIKIFFWKKEILIPVYPDLESVPENPELDTFMNFASFRSATDATWQALRSGRFAHIVIIAEGIPEREIREIIAYNQALQSPVRIIGPATAGAIAAGCLRMGNSGGSLDNIIESRLYKKGNVGFVSRSGGMSNEMYRVISHRTSGVHTGIALGGDRFVCSTFRDIVLEYEDNPEIECIVMLGEVGSEDELEVVKLIKSGKIQKPIIAHVIGSFAEKLKTEVQFGHAGAKANADAEKANYKNQALREAGAYVADTYAEFGDLIEQVWKEHFGERVLTDDTLMIDQKLSDIKNRKASKFTSTISDERGEDVSYNGIPLTDYIHDASIARVIGALWLKRDLPDYALDYINTILILLADHGPAVSGATNTIVTARAGKDLLSSLVSGLLTIGPRFGGAIDGAARTWHQAIVTNESPEELIVRMKKSGNPIQWIGHKVKSKFNPDGRCVILKEKAKSIPVSRHLEFALAVEELTLEKKWNLILNVDGHIAASILDIFESIGMTSSEIEMYIDAGIFNAFFILARSIGFIGHALDQKRLGESLYRTAWEDIHYGE